MEADSTSAMETEADSTSTMEMEMEASGGGEVGIPNDKRWSFLGEIQKTVNSLVNKSFPELKKLLEEFGSQVYRGEKPGDYNCHSVLKIWPLLINDPELWEQYSHIEAPKNIGDVIRDNLQADTFARDMIDEPSVDDLGFVALSLSRKWLVKSIHKMLKDGIDTWAPILPVERVIVDFPSLDEKIHLDLLRRLAIAHTLTRMLNYSGVFVADRFCGSHSPELPLNPDSALMVNNSQQISIIQRKACDTDWVIHVDGKPPFIIAKTDFKRSSLDMQTLLGLNEAKADWLVYITPVRQQEYIEMCFTAAKQHEGSIITDMKGRWNSSCRNEYPVFTYAGYRTCSIKPEELVNLLGKVKARCDKVAQGPDVQSLKYTAKAIFNCVLRYTFLKNNRLADCTFNYDEMVKEEGNTFVYLLQTRAEVHRVTNDNDFKKGIDELKKASDLTLEKYEGYEKGEERMLEFHLLKFNQVLKESSMFFLPHMMCEYLYDLSKKFKSFYDLVSKTPGSVVETSRLLLCEATSVVMGICFDLLGITKLPMDVHDLLMDEYAPPKDIYVEPDKKKQKMGERNQSAETTLEPEFVDRFITPCFVSDARLRDPVRTSRFEVFTIRPEISTDLTFESGKLFGLISVSDKYGVRSDRGYHLFQPDFAYVSLFNHECCDPIDIDNRRGVFLENFPSVPFSSSIEVQMELYVTTEKKDECFQLCDTIIEIDSEQIWGEDSNGKCGCVSVGGEDGGTVMYYILLKDAVDVSLEVKYTARDDRVVHGNINAYYGGEFSYDCDPLDKAWYKPLLFCSFLSNTCTLPLKRSMLAVPNNASLVIESHFTDAVTNKVIFMNRHNFPIRDGNSKVELDGGAIFSLELEIVVKK